MTPTFRTIRIRRGLAALALALSVAGCGDDGATGTTDTATPTAIAASAGSGQTVVAGSAVATPFGVRVVNAAGTGLPGVAVTWAITAGGGSLGAATTTTDAGGVATTTYTAGTTVGTATVTATVSGLSAVTFTTTVTAATATANTVAVVSGNNQSVVAGAPAATPFTVRVTSAAGAAVSGATVTFTVVAGGGTLSAATATTDASGNASTTYTAGAAAGTATVSASVAGGSSASFTATVTAAGTGTVSDSTTARTLAALTAFTATLSTAQQTTLQVALTQANASRWSNLPVGMTPRNGLQLGSLSAAQLTAALAVARAALSDSGYGTFQQIRAADDYLAANGGGSAYGGGLYYVAVLGTPSASARWILQIGGHHYAASVVFNGTAAPRVAVIDAPFFIGLEPLRFTLNGVSYAPMQRHQRAIYALVASLDATQRTQAQLATRFDDLLAGAGNDATFPATSVGIPGSSLTAAQRTLVRTAIEQWVRDVATGSADVLMADYGADSSLQRTYVAWATSTDSATVGSYVRIDGPRAWIEFSVQNGIIFRANPHYHTIFRDKVRQYGGSLSTAALEAAAFRQELAGARYRFAPAFSDGELRLASR